MDYVDKTLAAAFCANPECEYHGLQINKYTFRMTVATDGEGREMKRHSHKNEDGTEELFFCDICHRAIETAGELDRSPALVH